MTDPASFGPLPRPETERFIERLQEPDTGPLPDTVYATQAFTNRLPSQRMIDLLAKLEPGAKFGELIENQPGRVYAFRALVRDHPTRDPTSLWLHAYDVEVAIVEADPTNGSGPTPSLPSLGITG